MSVVPSITWTVRILAAVEAGAVAAAEVKGPGESLL